MLSDVPSRIFPVWQTVVSPSRAGRPDDHGTAERVQPMSDRYLDRRLVRFWEWTAERDDVA
jgi:hypothetical protein